MQKISELGFGVTITEEVILSIEGMTCQSCVNKIESTVSEKPGVISVSVSLEEKEGKILYKPTDTNADTLRDHVGEMFIANIKSKISQPGTCLLI